MSTVAEADYALALATLARGELVAFPTETVYGLGGDASNPDALRRIYALKGRPLGHPLIVHLAPEAALTDWATNLPGAMAALAEAFWPGPLTLVLKRAAGVLDLVTGGQDTVGLRKPAHPVAIELLRRYARGVAAPSANRYGRISPTAAAHVRDEFGADAPFVLNGGDCTVGLESTIVGWLEDAPVLLRPGHIGRAELERVAGPLRAAPLGRQPRVSGSDASHYAPRAPTRLLEASVLDERATARAAVLARRAAPAGYAGPRWLQAPADAAGYGRRLYAALRELDALNPLEILIEMVPDEPEWEAVRDRLGRAAGR